MRFTAIEMAHGGSAVARLDGKAYFIDGALPGEVIEGEIELDKGSWGRVRLLSVEQASEQRIAPRCRHFERCGGCQWQHGTYQAQLQWKRSTVAGQLAHLGQIANPPVRPTVAATPYHYRNRMDYKVYRGRPALHERKSRRLVPLFDCEILHPNLSAVFADLGDLSGVKTLTLRTSTTTGDVLVVIEGVVPKQAATWGCNVAVVSKGEIQGIIGEPLLEETISGVTFRITGNSFFQNNTAGAEQLVELATEAAAVTVDDTLLDAYAGGGLFAATVGRDAGRVVAIERDAVAANDLHANLNRAGIDDFRIMRAATEDVVERIDEYWDVAIADPPRQGLGAEGVAAITAAGPRTVVYVSCDPASLARDSAILDETGYELEWVTPVDMFPQTFHVECVARYRRVD